MASATREKLSIWCTSHIKDCLFWLNVILYLENCAILMLPVDHIENGFGIFHCA